MNSPNELADWQDHLETALPTDTLVRVYQQTASTQDIAKSFSPKKALIIADQQTAGRGRLGRAWASAPGASVLMSLVWPTAQGKLTHDRVSMLTGLCLARVVRQLIASSEVRLKWPNDVMVEGQKIAGILIEAVPHAFVIGIGLNVTHKAIADTSLTKTSTCLEAHGPPQDRPRVIEQIVLELERTLSTTDPSPLLDSWRAMAALGQTQTVEHNNQRITGEVLDLDPDHGLIVRRGTGEIVTLPAATTSVVKQRLL